MSSTNKSHLKKGGLPVKARANERKGLGEEEGKAA